MHLLQARAPTDRLRRHRRAGQTPPSPSNGARRGAALSRALPLRADGGEATAPRAPPKKTHAVTGDRGGGAVQSSRDDDAGYVLYQTEQFFYLASHDHSRDRWRLAKISRRSDSLEVDEHAAEYDREQLKALMSAVHKGNEGTGGLEIVSKGSGVVAFVELSATTRDEDPSAAAASGPRRRGASREGSAARARGAGENPRGGDVGNGGARGSSLLGRSIAKDVLRRGLQRRGGAEGASTRPGSNPRRDGTRRGARTLPGQLRRTPRGRERTTHPPLGR